MQKALIWGSLLSLGAVSLAIGFPGDGKPPEKSSPAVKADEAAVQRARETVQLLDNVYKQTIVLVTEKYVHDETDFAAGSAVVELFKRIEAGGSHKIRLIDATGKPYDAKNVAQNDFEREGIKQLKAGKGYYDEVTTKEGQRVLRAVTTVPVVMKRCIMCHEHYADAKDGEPIGALSYEFPIKS